MDQPVEESPQGGKGQPLGTHLQVPLADIDEVAPHVVGPDLRGVGWDVVSGQPGFEFGGVLAVGPDRQAPR